MWSVARFSKRLSREITMALAGNEHAARRYTEKAQSEDAALKGRRYIWI
ncbi:MAG: hypothetical protein ACRD51_01060 [Candidatus Acidiferrum sp.]